MSCLFSTHDFWRAYDTKIQLDFPVCLLHFIACRMRRAANMKYSWDTHRVCCSREQPVPASFIEVGQGFNGISASTVGPGSELMNLIYMCPLQWRRRRLCLRPSTPLGVFINFRRENVKLLLTQTISAGYLTLSSNFSFFLSFCPTSSFQMRHLKKLFIYVSSLSR